MTIGSIRVAPSASARLMQESRDKLPNETGGVLLGYSAGSVAYVTDIVGPGPRARHGQSGFTRDGEYAQEKLEAAFVESGGRIDYLGEWHSHPALVGASGKDKRSMARIGRNPAYGCAAPLLLLCCAHPDGGWRLIGYQWRSCRLVTIPVVSEEPSESKRPQAAE